LYQEKLTKKMEKNMTNFLKIALAVTLFVGTTMADGQMGSGGCNENCPPPPCTENCGRPTGDGDTTLFETIVKGFAKLYFGRV
jgi:hypothetical protein